MASVGSIGTPVYHHRCDDAVVGVDVSYFDLAIETVLRNEGGYKPATPEDSGGETNWGISQRSFPDVDIRNLTRQAAIDIYHQHYWLPVYGKIASQAVATRVLDMAVNMGAHQAHRIVQLALRGLGFHDTSIDGSFGDDTLTKVNGIAEARLLPELKAQACLWYATLACAKPEKRPNLLGWIRRTVQ